MAWVAVDKNNDEYIYDEQPIRYKGCWYVKYHEEGNPIGDMILLPKGTIKKLIGRDLSWEDNPVELDTFAWKDIENWDSYCISTLGDVLSMKAK